MGQGTRVCVLSALALALLLSTTPLPALPTTPSPFFPSHRGARVVAVSSPDVDDWPVYMHDASRSGANRNESAINGSNAATLVTNWKWATAGIVSAQPAVVEGTAYIGSWDGNEYAVNVSTGKEVWAQNLSTVLNLNCSPIPEGIASSAAVVGGVVYVGAATGWWYALSAANGSVLWRVFLENSSAFYDWSSPLIVGGAAYVGIASACDAPMVRGGLWEISLATHRVTHRFFTVKPGRLGAGIWGSPTYDPTTNSVFVTTGNGQSMGVAHASAILSLNATTLALQSYWHIPNSQFMNDSDFGSTASIFNGTAGANGTNPNGSAGLPLVGAVNKNGYFYAFNRSNLSLGPLWSFRVATGGQCPECGQGSIVSAVSDGAGIYVGGGATVINGTPYKGSVAKLDTATGSLVWEVGLRGAVIPALSYSNGLLFAESGSRLIVFDATSGKVLRSIAAGTALYGSASIAEGCVFFGTTGGLVYELGAKGVRCGIGAPISHGAGAHSSPGVTGGLDGTSLPSAGARGCPALVLNPVQLRGHVGGSRSARRRPAARVESRSVSARRPT